MLRLSAIPRTVVHRSPSSFLQPKVNLPLILRHSFHEDYKPGREEQTLRLSSGATLGFAEYGSQKDDATPAFFFHGAPGARYDGLGYHKAALNLNVRIICPDRPGHGLSTHVPSRKLIDYPKEISELARHLKLSKYHVFGQSGGGPYAVACAMASPANELLSSTVVAGIGPPGSVTTSIAGYYTVFALSLHKYMPSTLQKLMAWYYSPAFLNDEVKLQKHLDSMYKWLPKEDQKVIADPKAQPVIREVLKAAFAQHATGVVRDGEIYARQELWGFELKDVKRPIGLIFGKQDTRTPVAFGRYYKQHLRDAWLWEIEDASHFRLEQYLEPILARVVGKEVLQEERKVNSSESREAANQKQ